MYTPSMGDSVAPHNGETEAGAGPAAVHQHFRELVLGPDYPCLGAAGAVRRGDYRMRSYPELGSAAAVRACVADLTAFLQDFPHAEHPVAILVAVFGGPEGLDEIAFERLLWAQLHGMRAAERASAAVARPPLAGRDEQDPGYGFGDRDFFVVGLHPGAVRTARRFSRPTLVFNALTHAEALQNAGRFHLMRDRIRARDLRLHGTPNPNLARCQWAQFSGRDVGGDWGGPGWID